MHNEGSSMTMQTTAAGQPTTRVRSLHTRRAAAMQGKIADMAIAKTRKDFVVWCSLPAVSSLAEVVHALYYLPQNFTLMIPRMTAEDESISAMVADSSLAGRVRVYEHDGSSRDEPLLLADATINSLADSSLTVVPVRYMDPTAEAGLSVGQSPEAVASALLEIFRSA